LGIFSSTFVYAQAMRNQGSSGTGAAQTSLALASSSILDGSFETTNPSTFNNPNWTEGSSNFGSPLCTMAACGSSNPIGPTDGSWFAWFGGIVNGINGNLPEISFIEQEVQFPNPPERLVLSFNLRLPTSCADGFIDVLVDGIQVHRIDDSSGLCGVDQTHFVTTDLVGFSDGNLRMIRIQGTQTSSTDPFFSAAIDEIGLEVQLPVELAAFNAVVHEGSALLTWETASEKDNIGFEIEHRFNNESFQSVGFLQGYGTTSEVHHYRFETLPLRPGVHTFRLKQIDFDGGFAYSENLELFEEVPNQFFLDHVYPNPFNPQASVRMSVANSQEVRLELFNTLGQMVQPLYAGHLQANQIVTAHIDGSSLPSGVYFVRMTGRTASVTQTVTLSR
jgi:hypothetical protein